MSAPSAPTGALAAKAPKKDASGGDPPDDLSGASTDNGPSVADSAQAGVSGRTPAPRLSIIIVSRHRPDHLAQCLRALEAQDHPDFELILVADPGSVALRPDLALKRTAFDEANISAARNLGLAQAAGEVVAFIDDDALALPHWARVLAAPFADPRVMAATGFTRGADGMRWQAQAERIGADGLTRPFLQTGPALFASDFDTPISTIGTNCAFRRAALAKIGGFDPLFPYHLDESDVNLRMARRFPAGLTAVVPAAEVIHGAAAGPLRPRSGVPSDLRPVGRSTAAFVRRHGGMLPDLEGAQRARLLRLMLSGRLDPFAIAPLLAGLRQGLAEGREMALPPPPEPWDHPVPDFLPFRRARFLMSDQEDEQPLILTGWHWRRHALRARAARLAQTGRIVCLILWTPTILPHRLARAEGGWWEQTGGIWGFLGPEDPLGLPGLLKPARRMAKTKRAACCRLVSKS